MARFSNLGFLLIHLGTFLAQKDISFADFVEKKSPLSDFFRIWDCT